MGGQSGVPVALEHQLDKSGLAQSVAGVRSEMAKAGGSEIEVTGVDPARIGDSYNFYTADPKRALTGNGAIVESSYAKKQHLRVGSSFRMTLPSGKRLTLRVTAIETLPAIAKMQVLMGKVTLSAALFDRSFQRPSNKFLFVKVDPARAAFIDTAGQKALEKQFPGLDVLKGSAWIDEQVNSINTLLNLLYVLLGLSVLVSLFGMLNALALSVFERTREIGMLRAVGMTRGQLRRMIRNESVVIALIGGLTGIALGLAFAAMIAGAAASEGIKFSVPLVALAAFAGLAAAAGMLAAALPARRAGRMDVLDALHYE